MISIRSIIRRQRLRSCANDPDTGQRLLFFGLCSVYSYKLKVQKEALVADEEVIPRYDVFGVEVGLNLEWEVDLHPGPDQTIGSSRQFRRDMGKRIHAHIRHREPEGPIWASERFPMPLGVNEVALESTFHKQLHSTRRDLGLDGLRSQRRQQMDLDIDPFLLSLIDKVIEKVGHHEI